MLPKSIRSLLRRVRQRERFQAFAWSAAMWFTAVVVVMVLFCAVDFTIDLYQDTPWWVRQMVMGPIVVLLMMAACVFPVIAARRYLSDKKAALWVEERCPAFHHRL